MSGPLFAMSDETAGIIVASIAIPLFGLLLVGLVFVIRDTVRGKGRWGISTKPAACKKCGTPPPFIRKPASLQQALWGGWTCEECGYELDKWGEPLPGQPEPAKWKMLEAAEAAEVDEVAEAEDSPSTAVKSPGQVKKRPRKDHDD
jgi:hypothetical protein